MYSIRSYAVVSAPKQIPGIVCSFIKLYVKFNKCGSDFPERNDRGFLFYCSVEYTDHGGLFCMLLGLEKFLGVRLKHTLQYLFLLLFLLAQVYFT